MPDSDYRVLVNARNLAALIRSEFPDVDGQTLADTIEGELDINGALYRTILWAEEDRMLAEGIDARLKELRERKARLEDAFERKRAIVQQTMEQCGITSMKHPEFSAFLARSPAKVIVTEEALIPERFWRVKREVDKTALSAELKSGTAIAGATLSNGGQHLTIRRT